MDNITGPRFSVDRVNVFITRQVYNQPGQPVDGNPLRIAEIENTGNLAFRILLPRR
jgi:hypothetical protein